MVYTKRRKYRKRKRTTYKKKYRKYSPRSKKLISGKRYSWKRYYDGTGSGTTGGSGTMPSNVLVVAGTTVNIGFDFKASYIRNMTEFTALFSAYKLNCVVVKVRQAESSANSTTAGQSKPVMCHIAYDQTAITAPSTTDELRDYRTYRAIPLTQQWKKIKVYPRVYAPLENTHSYYQVVHPWILTADTQAIQAGLKMSLVNDNGTDGKTVEFEYVYYFSTKIQS